MLSIWKNHARNGVICATSHAPSHLIVEVRDIIETHVIWLLIPALRNVGWQCGSMHLHVLMAGNNCLRASHVIDVKSNLADDGKHLCCHVKAVLHFRVYLVKWRIQ